MGLKSKSVSAPAFHVLVAEKRGRVRKQGGGGEVLRKKVSVWPTLLGWSLGSNQVGLCILTAKV